MDLAGEIYHRTHVVMKFKQFHIVMDNFEKGIWIVSDLETSTPGFGFGGVYVGVPGCNKAYLLKTFKRYKPEKKEYKGEKTLYIDFHKEFYRQLLIELDKKRTCKISII